MTEHGNITINPGTKDSQEVWDKRWMELCQHISSWSKDKSRKVAAVIIGKDNVLLAIGYNGFPRGVNDDVESRHERPDKYLWTEHAERNAIYNAASAGITIKGATLYMPWYPCMDCARGIIQSGIAHLVLIEPDWNDPKYGTDFKLTMEMLKETQISTRWFKGEPPVQKPL